MQTTLVAGDAEGTVIKRACIKRAFIKRTFIKRAFTKSAYTIRALVESALAKRAAKNTAQGAVGRTPETSAARLPERPDTLVVRLSKVNLNNSLCRLAA
jgi:hypothetical protein